MITEDRMRVLFAEANPVPDEESIVLDERDVTAYLATLEQRSSEVTKLDTKGTSVSWVRRSATPWLAAAAVVVLGVAVTVGGFGGEDQQPADEVTRSLDIAERFVQGLEILDAGAVEGLVTDEAAAMYLATFGYDETRPGSIEGMWEWIAISDMTYTFEGCRQTSMAGDPPPTGSPADRGMFFTCDYEVENDWTRALDESPMSGHFRLEVTDGQIVWLFESFPFTEIESTYAMVVEWIQTEYPDDFDKMLFESGATARLTPESLRLWREYTPQITESLSN